MNINMWLIKKNENLYNIYNVKKDSAMSFGSELTDGSKKMILSNDKYRFDLHEYNDFSNNIYYVDDNRKKYYLGILNGNLNAGAEIIAARNLSNNTAYWYLERANFKKGDVNMDGIIDESDYIIIDKIIKGNIYATVTEKYLADINYDDSITDADYQKVCDMVEK